jgi:CRP/FNR family transcriptional regulator
LCRAAAVAQWSEGHSDSPHIEQTGRRAPARRIFCGEEDLKEFVPIICKGWAASAFTLSDGSRQILSFLLPGDIVSTALLFGSRSHHLIEAVTDVSYRMFKRAELKAILLKNPDFF